MAIQGINLGGWLVAERWITPSLFEGTQVYDEYSLSLLGEKYRRKISQHHHSFITEKDILWLKRHDITLLRVPVGYWVFGDEEPYGGSIERLDWLFDVAKKHGLYILLDIHGAPGSQNGKQHSGKIGAIEWRQHISQLEQVTKKLFLRYADSTHLWGIELLNEPAVTLRHSFTLWRYYYKMSHWISGRSNDVKVIIAEGKAHLLWAMLARFGNMTLDYHVYHGFHGRDINESQSHMNTFSHRLNFLQKITPVIVGEWSGVVSQKTDSKKIHGYIHAQRKTYQSAVAWCYWTYKTEGGGVWSYRDAVISK